MKLLSFLTKHSVLKEFTSKFEDYYCCTLEEFFEDDPWDMYTMEDQEREVLSILEECSTLEMIKLWLKEGKL
jgi:hypothetical protein